MPEQPHTPSAQPTFRKRPTPPTAQTLLQRNPQLKAWQKRSQQLSRLAERIAVTLPPPLFKQLEVGNFRDGRLVLFAANAAAASELRYLAADLSETLRLQGLRLSGIDIRISPARPKPSGAAKAHALSKVSASLLQQASLGFSDARISQALQRLAAGSPNEF